MKYKVLTLHQPWAQLMAIGAKRFETRSWSTNYTGPIAIHAGKNTEELLKLIGRISTHERQHGDLPKHTFASHYLKAMTEFYSHRFTVDDFPLGAVVAVGTLVAVHRCETLTNLSAQERLFGLHMNGRFAWEISDVSLLEKPFMIRGQQGLWDMEYDHEVQL